MSNNVMRRTLRITVEIGLIIFSGWLVSVLYFTTTGQVSNGQAPEVEIGSPFLLDDLPAESRLVVIATSPVCNYSEGELSFHRELIQQAAPSGTASMVLTPAGVPAGFTSSLTAHAKYSRSLNLGGNGILRTPTVILVENGIVAGLWVGRVVPRFQVAALLRVTKGGHTLTDRRSQNANIHIPVDSSLTSALADYIPIDVREREEFRQGHMKGARNIPLSELWLRGAIELPLSPQKLLIDCRQTQPAACRAAQDLMTLQGFSDITLLDIGAYGAYCAAKATN